MCRDVIHAKHFLFTSLHRYLLAVVQITAFEDSLVTALKLLIIEIGLLSKGFYLKFPYCIIMILFFYYRSNNLTILDVEKQK